MVRAESSVGVEQSLLCNFLWVQIGQGMGCWLAQHGNLTSIICLSTLSAVVGRTRSSMPAHAQPTTAGWAGWAGTLAAVHFSRTGSSVKSAVWAGLIPLDSSNTLNQIICQNIVVLTQVCTIYWRAVGTKQAFGETLLKSRCGAPDLKDENKSGQVLRESLVKKCHLKIKLAYMQPKEHDSFRGV